MLNPPRNSPYRKALFAVLHASFLFVVSFQTRFVAKSLFCAVASKIFPKQTAFHSIMESFYTAGRILY